MNNTEARPTIGIPYASNCLECYRAVICPSCGTHLAGGKHPDARKEGIDIRSYQKHWDDEHAFADRIPSQDWITVAPDGCPLV